MTGAKKIKVLILLGALVLFVLLFIAPKKAPSALSEGSREAGSKPALPLTSGDLSVYLKLALKNLEPKQKGSAEKLMDLKNFDSLAVIWNQLKRPDLSAYFVEEKAKLLNSSESWNKAGNKYFTSVQFCEDQSEIPVIYQCALRCFNKSLELDPKNVDSKIMLASCYVDGTDTPMEGISRLKELEKTESNNIKLQLTFAFFSVKSGQLDKAISRFNKVIAIDSNYIEAYLHLADAYESSSKPAQAIQMLEAYSDRTDDITAKLEIKKYIEQLKNK